MTLADLVAAVYLRATGKVSSLAATDSKYTKIRDIANIYIHIWEDSYDWYSLYVQNQSLGAATATDTFAIPSSVRKLSDAREDYVQIEDVDGLRHDFAIVPPDELKRYEEGSKVCSQIGSNLVFRKAFASDDPLIGGTLYVPCYAFADTLATASDVVPVDIPQWLVLMTAAEYVRNDVTKQNQYPNLVAEANVLMERMIENNDAQINEYSTPYFLVGRTW